MPRKALLEYDPTALFYFPNTFALPHPHAAIRPVPRAGVSRHLSPGSPTGILDARAGPGRAVCSIPSLFSVSIDTHQQASSLA
jgi:hypothetical protein